MSELILTGESDDEAPASRSKRETLAIPQSLRLECADRDQGYCRVCGRHVGEQGALHHIRYGGDYQGMGGRRNHSLDNLITVGWTPSHDCHSLVHGNKNLWLPYLVVAAERSGVSAMQLMRWERRHQSKRSR